MIDLSSALILIVATCLVVCSSQESSQLTLTGCLLGKTTCPESKLSSESNFEGELLRCVDDDMNRWMVRCDSEGIVQSKIPCGLNWKCASGIRYFRRTLVSSPLIPLNRRNAQAAESEGDTTGIVIGVFCGVTGGVGILIGLIAGLCGKPYFLCPCCKKSGGAGAAGVVHGGAEGGVEGMCVCMIILLVIFILFLPVLVGVVIGAIVGSLIRCLFKPCRAGPVGDVPLDGGVQPQPGQTVVPDPNAAQVAQMVMVRNAAGQMVMVPAQQMGMVSNVPQQMVMTVNAAGQQIMVPVSGQPAVAPQMMMVPNSSGQMMVANAAGGQMMVAAGGQMMAANAVGAPQMAAQPAPNPVITQTIPLKKSEESEEEEEFEDEEEYEDEEESEEEGSSDS